MAKDTAKKLAVTGAIAGLVGYVAGILTAPKSGRETRKDIKDATQKGVVEAEKQLKRLHTELAKVLDETKTQGGKFSDKAREEFNKVVERAKDAKEKARQALSAIHDGGAEDKDLQKAIDEATKALDHLKKFVAK